MPSDYAKFLKELCIFTQRKHIIEIGVAFGDTALELCEAARINGGQYYGYDGYSVNTPPTNLAEVRNKLNEAGYGEYSLTQINTTTEEFRNLFKQKHTGADFVFIDAGHSYKEIEYDFHTVYPCINEFGIIAIHDTVAIDGVREFMIELRTSLNDNSFDMVELPFSCDEMKLGINILVKRSFAKGEYPIRWCIGAKSSPEDILKREKQI